MKDFLLDTLCSKTFRVFNSRTRIVQETLHVNFMENKPNVAGSVPAWLFDIDSLSRTMNYHPVIVETQTNSHADVLVDEKEHDDDIQKFMSPDIHSSSSGAQIRKQELKECTNNNINGVNAASSLVSTAGHNFINNSNDFSAAGPSNAAASPTAANFSSKDASTSTHDSDMPNLEDLTHSDDADDVGAEADINNLESIISVSLIPTTRIHKDHLTSQIIGDLSSTTQTRSMARAVRDQALKDPSWIEAMQEELLQFKMQKVRILVDLPYGKRAIGTKWVYKNKKDERGIVIRNKASLVAQGHTQEEGIDYEEVFAPVVRIKAIRLFLTYASFMGFLVYQMDVKSAFLYGTIEEEVYVCQPPRFKDPKNLDKVYKVVKALYGLHQALRAWYETLATYLLENGFQRGTIDQTLFNKKQQKDILLVQIYVDDIIFEKPLLKDSDGKDVDVHTYRLISWQCKKQTVVATSSTEAEYVAATSGCAQMLWIQNQLLDYGYNFMHTDSHFDLVAYSDSDYVGASLDKKSTTRGCQFLICRLISWQCKKQTDVATSSTEAEYVAAASGCAQMLWI
nr:hypothetical protein [Tanacetum cinerariifolium]